ncbi:hypothetical protein BM1374166_00790 [Bartonella tribocorum]|nr:hypothetical protein BM1374166_00790 [Bartonella tribocorum]
MLKIKGDIVIPNHFFVIKNIDIVLSMNAKE